MKRNELLKRLGVTVPETKMKRVIISSDITAEADDPFAVMHHLLSPSEDIRGIIAAHYEMMPRMITARFKNTSLSVLTPQQQDTAKRLMANRGKTMGYSFAEGEKILQLAQIDDVPMLHGAAYELSVDGDPLPESEGADFIIEEAMKESSRPLFVVFQGNITDLAIAYLKEPKIAEKLTAVWIGGTRYPYRGRESNLLQDAKAANIIFQSKIPLWQIPINVYETMEFSLAELNLQIRSCGDIGKYLFEEMTEKNHSLSRLTGLGIFPHGETWSLGDNPTVAVLLQAGTRICWDDRPAPSFVREDGTYGPENKERMIRVYNYVDPRLTLSDMFAKMQLVYGC